MAADEELRDKPVPYQQQHKAILLAYERTLEEMKKGQQMALADMLDTAKQGGREALELDEMRKSAEAKHAEQQEKLKEQCRDRLDELAIRFKDRDKEGRER